MSGIGGALPSLLLTGGICYRWCQTTEGRKAERQAERAGRRRTMTWNGAAAGERSEERQNGRERCRT
ncbi:hypothetical protein [Drancourtella sp. An12]|uniref:hypothetical protein n=1 Tax=Drancourtella sp. An12 TaxID=1965548 RepID=UPI0011226437|nr:hypothetical protein [Drancourtella sp. An12]